MTAINGFEYPQVDGYTIRISMKLSDELKRKFPARTVMAMVPPKDVIDKNVEIIEWNKENPDDMKKLIVADSTLQEVQMPAGAINFDVASECCLAYAMIVNSSIEVKANTMPTIQPDVMMELMDAEDHPALAEKVAMMLGITKGKKVDETDEKN